MLSRCFCVLLCVLGLQAQEARIRILGTSDLKAQVLPQDPFTLAPVPGGWARLGTLVRLLKAEVPDSLLVDCGDGTGGSPMAYVWSRLHPDRPEPVTAVLNGLGATAMTVGHLELMGGFKQIRAMEEQAKFPWLAANVRFAATGKLAFTPYQKVEVAGVQVAILGLVARPRPALPDPLEGLVVEDPVACAKEMVPVLRQKEKVDVVIVALHGGAAETCAGDPESPSACLAQQVKGIDLILAGHTGVLTQAHPGGVPVLQPGSRGAAVAVADLTLRRARGRWEVGAVATRLERPAADLEPDPGVLQATAELRAFTDAYLDTLATQLATDLDGRWGRMEDTPLAHLLHTVLRQATGAQVTAVPAPSKTLFIPKGPTSVRQFYALSPTDDPAVRIQVTGRQLRAYLEHAAKFFSYSHHPDLFNRQGGPGEFDTLEGVTYALDISREPGARVVTLTVQGKPVKDDQVFSLGLPARRLAGAGGYVEAMGWKGRPEAVTAEPLRNLLLAHVLAKPSLSVGTVDTWRIIPALDRERVLAQQP
ncbi:bifunctional metallophosphatase/5'-nucleotidase [Mesoterricola sediminis]|uniref:Multifunctional 2',3'-cyclic-nucleotide 2'-phosphodiesterase/5'-nucleotidase/3'-nucleotidase n=1 Tax=Mesoterricola sediminis TaxID=2927980 RepID=A0AA48HHV2_9BACT|nr:bifunctional UDP-sugar hydrolase/5'-nucleotidase [Mesoterricola sediminis]BDU78498.1 multifunctional 2',3'-cyclic-nucleotide 2'-phosphodiesterase/5'-nucleotidase/3'-nucleotidase [Mesoterricola sediminis]